jgi:hypothetical protein
MGFFLVAQPLDRAEPAPTLSGSPRPRPPAPATTGAAVAG